MNILTSLMVIVILLALLWIKKEDWFGWKKNKNQFKKSPNNSITTPYPKQKMGTYEFIGRWISLVGIMAILAVATTILIVVTIRILSPSDSDKPDNTSSVVANTTDDKGVINKPLDNTRSKGRLVRVDGKTIQNQILYQFSDFENGVIKKILLTNARLLPQGGYTKTIPPSGELNSWIDKPDTIIHRPIEKPGLFIISSYSDSSKGMSGGWGVIIEN